VHVLGRTREPIYARRVIKRGLAIVATLALLGVGAAIATMVRDSWREARAFHPATFRAAAANDDSDALEDEARAAIRHRALYGGTRAEVRAMVGKPDRVDRELHLYQWDVQLNTWFFGLPEGGCVCVEFDPKWQRVTRVVLR
jgi:hypothetical protein